MYISLASQTVVFLLSLGRVFPTHAPEFCSIFRFLLLHCYTVELGLTRKLQVVAQGWR